MLYFQNEFFKRYENLLLMVWKSGVYMFSLSRQKQNCQASVIDLACQFFNGTDMKAFESSSALSQISINSLIWWSMMNS